MKLPKGLDYKYRCIEDYLIDHYEKNLLCRIILCLMGIPDYLEYLFAKADNPRYASLNKIEDWWIRLRCRMKHHPCGIIYYNPGGYEPDGRCKECGDEIG